MVLAARTPPPREGERVRHVAYQIATVVCAHLAPGIPPRRCGALLHGATRQGWLKESDDAVTS